MANYHYVKHIYTYVNKTVLVALPTQDRCPHLSQLVALFRANKTRMPDDSWGNSFKYDYEINKTFVCYL